MNFPCRETVESLRTTYPVGCRVVLDHMDDPYVHIPVGPQATVTGVDDIASVMCAWDEGGSLSVAYGADRCHKIGTEAEAKDHPGLVREAPAGGGCHLSSLR